MSVMAAQSLPDCPVCGISLRWRSQLWVLNDVDEHEGDDNEQNDDDDEAILLASAALLSLLPCATL